MRTVPVAARACTLPAPTVRRLHNGPARAALWAVVLTLFLVALLT